jgi:tetratricopeptide (TPR) repeat protein
MSLSLDDELPGLNNNLADAYYLHGLQLNDSVVFSQCFEYYKKAIELDSLYAAPYRGLGLAYRQVGNLEGAIYCWGKALEMIPDSSQVVIDLAQVYLDTGDKAKAFDVLSDYKKQYYHLIPSVEREKIKALLEKARK